MLGPPAEGISNNLAIPSAHLPLTSPPHLSHQGQVVLFGTSFFISFP